VDVALVRSQLALHARVERPHRIFTDHLERHALREVAERTAIGKQRFLRMREHVDEARRDRLAVRVDQLARPQAARRAHIGDAIGVDRHFTGIGLAAQAVVDQAIVDHEVVHGRGDRRGLRGGRIGGCGVNGGRHAIKQQCERAALQEPRRFFHASPPERVGQHRIARSCSNRTIGGPGTYKRVTPPRRRTVRPPAICFICAARIP
jgi:hypothetical protein